MFKTRNPLLVAVAALVLAGGACADRTAVSPLAPTDTPQLSSASATLLECPSDLAVSASRTIDLLGGTVTVVDPYGGTHQVSFPASAVVAPTVFKLEVPAAQYVKVRVTATDALTGQPVEVAFPADAQPVLAVSYKRCTRNNVGNLPLQLYNVDETTNAVLEGPFGAKEGNPTDPRVVGAVPHFSDYSLGSP